ncbi:hypothetical protein BKA63DRAFT_588114, partial [Paraphoma chrysanthemicola]
NLNQNTRCTVEIYTNAVNDTPCHNPRNPAVGIPHQWTQWISKPIPRKRMSVLLSDLDNTARSTLERRVSAASNGLRHGLGSSKALIPRKWADFPLKARIGAISWVFSRVSLKAAHNAQFEIASYFIQHGPWEEESVTTRSRERPRSATGHTWSAKQLSKQDRLFGHRDKHNSAPELNSTASMGIEYPDNTTPEASASTSMQSLPQRLAPSASKKSLFCLLKLTEETHNLLLTL